MLEIGPITFQSSNKPNEGIIHEGLFFLHRVDFFYIQHFFKFSKITS